MSGRPSFNTTILVYAVTKGIEGLMIQNPFASA